MVTVVIAAYNAGDTVAAAVTSALAQPETGEVIVVDDCSSDETVAVAERAGDGDARLRVLQQVVNKGPAAARNRAIEAANFPFIAILDSDDRFLPGRFARIFSTPEWDLCADNIAFTRNRELLITLNGGTSNTTRSAELSLENFFIGNRNTSRVQRNELGFLKPVMRREFLDRHALRYAENCRLGEDFLLYARCLIAGAQFRVYEACGYAAHERADSLSGAHSLDDLCRFHEGLVELAPSVSCSAHKPLFELRRMMRKKIHHREVIQIRRNHGLAQGLMALSSRSSVVLDILRDKLRARTDAGPDWRMLIPPSVFDKLAA